MARLIDADALVEDIGNEIDKPRKVALLADYNHFYCAGMRNVIRLVKRLPTVDDIKHGHWEESKCLDDCFWVCSCCKFPSQASAAHKLYKYCPSCGAKMDKKEDENHDN